MELTIYKQDGTLKATVSPSSNSSWNKEIMADNVLNLSFTHYEYIKLNVNDYVNFQEECFKLLKDYCPVKKSGIEYQYDVKFYGTESELKKAIVLKMVDGDNDTNFSLTDNPASHLQLIVDNINRIKGTNIWKMGQVISAPNKDITYDSTFCFDALQKIAETFETEWWIEGTTIHLTRCEQGDLLELGYDKGLKDISKDGNDNAPFFTRLYPIGSTRNIDRTVYGSSRLHLPGGVQFVEQNISLGIVEYSEENVFKDIYPKRIGTVGVVRSVEKKGEDGKPFTVYYFTDPELNFNPGDYEIAGLIKSIVFQSGELDGYDFEVNWHNDTKEFEIINKYPYSNQQLPGGMLIPATGNEYILYNIKMPKEYYTLAEEELAVAVSVYLKKYSIDTAIYKTSSDYIYFEEHNINLKIGQRIRLYSDEYFNTGYRDSRVISFSRKVDNPQEMEIGSSMATSVGRISKIENSLSELQAVYRQKLSSTLEIIESTDNTTKPSDKNLYSALKAKQEDEKRLRKDILDNLPLGVDIGGFIPGAFGSGGCFRNDPKTGKTYIEVHKLLVKEEATFEVLNIHELKAVGGTIVVSCADMKCTEVTETANYYRCYFDNDEGRIFNQFDINDQARCQTFDGKNLKYYWRLIVGKGDNYIDLSKTDKDGSSIPSVDDKIIQFGNRTNPERQHLTLITAYGSEAPALIHYSGINSYTLSGREVTSIGRNSKFTGRVIFEFGSSGWENIEGLEEAINKAYTEARIYAEELIDGIGVGGVNLLMNSGFTGNYKPLDLKGSLRFSKKTDLFSDHFGNWIYTDAVDINPDEGSRSGYSCSLNAGRLEQDVSKDLLVDEIYCVSFIAKGSSVAVGLGGIRGTIVLYNDYKRYVFKVQIKDKSNFFISGNATVAELKVERGTIATDWTKAYTDADTAELRYQALDYVTNAIVNGSSEALGGLFLTNMIMLGNYADKQMTEVTAGISGTYNSSDDPAFWAGGTLLDALKAVMNPYLEDAAKAVITHGGKAIFNDAIIRGYIEALDGIFRGTVYATDGEFCGKVLTNKDGNRIVIQPGGTDLLDETKIVLLSPEDNILCEMGFMKGLNDEEWPAVAVNEYRDNELVAYSRIRAGRIEVGNKGEDGLYYPLSIGKGWKSKYMTIKGMFPSEDATIEGEMYRTEDGTLKIKLS